MKAIIFSLFVLLIPQVFYAQNVSFAWAKQIGGNGSDAGRSIALDASGNVYTTGYFSGIVDFDPGPGIFNLISDGDNDIFISKLNAAGNFIWAKKIGGVSMDRAHAIALDASGNIYTTGFFSGTADFDPGVGNYNLTAGGEYDIFISKLDLAGNFIWAKQMMGSQDGMPNHTIGIGYSIATDILGNVYTTGLFGGGTVDFDPGPGVFNLSTWVSLPNSDEDIFISKLDASGNFVWAKKIGGQMFNDIAYSIALDASGNVYTTGFFINTVDFDPGPGVFNLSANPGEIFISKLNAAGNFVWAKQMKGTGYYSEGHSIALDASGSIYTAGIFSYVVDFDPGPAVFNLNANNGNFFISKLDATGNFIWAKQMGASVFWGADGCSIAFDASGNIYTTGIFTGIADFDPGPGIFNLSSAGEQDIFISKLNANGNFVWAKQMGGISDDISYSIAVATSGDVYTSGAFSDIVDFDPGTATYNITAVGEDDIFIHKMSRCTNGTSSTITTSACSTYTLNSQTYTATGVYTQTLTNSAGCDSIITLNLTINNRYTTINVAACNSYTWNSQTYTSSGIYKDTIALANGCDSIITLNLVINSRSFSAINAAICTGQNYAGHTTAGTYIDTLIAANGCDSIRTLNLTIKPGSFSTIDTAICSGQNYGGHTTAGVYTDVLIASNGCDSVRTVNLIIKNNCSIYIPNAFTPNNDGLNDLFKPTINLPLQKFSFIIFNRYGEKIFETYQYGKGWDGTYKGKAQSTGSYVYRITFIDISGWESENNGSVLLLR